MQKMSQANKAGWAAFIGTTVEWYDFFIYGSAAALVFGPLFFPELNGAAGVLASFATFGIAFVARPLGAIVFGHAGDRLGRKKSLIITLLIMGFATFLIGCLPTYDEIGLLAPALLVVCRLLQGLSAGGEFGGAVLIASEHAGPKRFVAASAWAQQGAPAGNILATGAFFLVSTLPDDAFMAWGWRIPFLASAILNVVGLVIRLKLDESPDFVNINRTKTTVKVPFVELLKSYKLIILLGVLAAGIGTAGSSFLQVFAINWLTADLGMARDVVLAALLITTVAQFVLQPFSALLASKFRPVRVIVVSLSIALVTVPLGWYLMTSGRFALVAVGMVINLIPIAMMYGILGGFLAEAFPPAVRYSGTGVTYQISAMIFTSIAPVVSATLLASTGSIASVAVFQMVYVILGIVGSILLTRVTGSTDTITPAAAPTKEGLTTPFVPN